jgi:hypothetical protein
VALHPPLRACGHAQLDLLDALRSAAEGDSDVVFILNELLPHEPANAAKAAAAAGVSVAGAAGAGSAVAVASREVGLAGETILEIAQARSRCPALARRSHAPRCAAHRS